MACGHTALYEVLNVGVEASVPEIKKSYRKLAKEFHPDKNPLAGDKFKEISFAHEVLTDPQRRSVYDQYGMKGLQERTREPSSSFHDDIFSHFFNMDSGMGSRQFYSRRRSENAVFPLKVTLEDLYNGKSVKIPINRNVVCVTCSGSGTRTGMKYVCCACQGQGVRMQCRPALFMMQQIYSVCTDCKGSGVIIPDLDRCSQCRGQKTYVEKKMLEVHVEKGMVCLQKLVLRGQGHQVPNAEPGDVFIILEEESHDTFQRHGDDLYVKKEISLTEALCGFTFGLKHLDGRILKVVQPAGAVIKGGEMRGIENEGMPIQMDPTQKGNLYIKFNVVFPQNYFADEKQIKMIENLLGPRTEFIMPSGEDVEEVDLHEYTPTEENSSQGYGEAYSEDDEDQYGGHFSPGRVQCAQQ